MGPLLARSSRWPFEWDITQTIWLGERNRGLLNGLAERSRVAMCHRGDLSMTRYTWFIGPDCLIDCFGFYADYSSGMYTDLAVTVLDSVGTG